ncbi:MAG: hypothetical protein K940chlam1_00808 [Candidatus Anoxychlamydiales bacterium]|nr:hypothetical protein [Candidatus Anoxychlamydiales bacterium]NGX36569.1 hypothetical protein [Candidatus Anoxychlamydiales bacterium]
MSARGVSDEEAAGRILLFQQMQEDLNAMSAQISVVSKEKKPKTRTSLTQDTDLKIQALQSRLKNLETTIIKREKEYLKMQNKLKEKEAKQDNLKLWASTLIAELKEDKGLLGEQVSALERIIAKKIEEMASNLFDTGGPTRITEPHITTTQATRSLDSIFRVLSSSSLAILVKSANNIDPSSEE